MEFVGVVRLLGFVDKLRSLVKRPFVERIELLGGNGVFCAVEVVQVAELIHYGVSHAAVGVGYVRKNVVGNRNVVLVVHRAYPEANYVGAPFPDVHVGGLRFAVR